MKKFKIIVFWGVVLGVAVLIANPALNNRGSTEERAYVGSGLYIAKHDLKPKRLSCSGDSDGDGNGSCMVTLPDNEKIQLQCPTNFIDFYVWRARSCKEIDFNAKLIGSKNDTRS